MRVRVNYFRGLYKLGLAVGFLLLVSLLFNVTTQIAPASASWITNNSAWQYRQQITIDHSKISATLTDFPIYVNLADLGPDFFSVVKSDGSDIRITSVDGTTELAREVVSVDKVGQTGELYFKAPSLSHVNDSIFYVYYGNISATEPAVTDPNGRNAVWSNQFKAVYHMGQGNAVDSTGNGHDGTNHGTGSASGQLGVARSFNGVSDYITIPDDDSLTFNDGTADTPITITAWVNNTNVGKSSPILSKYDSFLPFRGEWASAVNANGVMVFQALDSTTTDRVHGRTANNTITNNLWTYFSSVYDASQADSGVAFYKDGVSVASIGLGDDTNYAGMQNRTGVMSIGASHYTGDLTYQQYAKGSIDEVRLASTERLAEWIAAEYANQGSAGTFYAVGSREFQTVPDAPTLVSAVGGDSQATVSFNPPVYYGNSPITGYSVKVSPGGSTVVGSASPIIVTGLTPGASYTFTVLSVNALGESLASSPSNSVAVSTVPGAPIGLETSVVNGGVKLDWQVPLSDGFSPITDYVVEYQEVGGSWTVYSDGIDTSTSTVVAGLTNDTVYNFRVSAANVFGVGLASDIKQAIPGELVQVLLQSIANVITPNIQAVAQITNLGSVDYSYHYDWCVTNSASNLCGGGDDIFASSATETIAPGSAFATTLDAAVSNPGDYYFHISVYYGSAVESAKLFFTATQPENQESAHVENQATAYVALKPSTDINSANPIVPAPEDELAGPKEDVPAERTPLQIERSVAEGAEQAPSVLGWWWVPPLLIGVLVVLYAVVRRR